MGSIADIIIQFIMLVYKTVSGSEIIYTEAPEQIIRPTRMHYLKRLCHFFPTIIIAIVITVKVLPLCFTTVDEHLQSNSPMMWLYSIGSFIVVGLMNGFLIEKFLVMINPQYRELTSTKKYSK